MRKGLLVVLVLTVIPLGLRADEKAAITALEKIGGRVIRDGKTPGGPVVQVMLSGPKVTDATVKELQNFRRLRQLPALNLTNTMVTDAGLKELKELKQLTILDLAGTKVTDAGIADLKKSLPKLRVAR